MNKSAVFVRFTAIGILLSAGLMMTGCSSKVSEKDLAQLLPEDIITYYCGSDLRTQKVNNITITKRKTERDTDYIECEITLADEFIERTLYEALSLTKYDTGGWQIDYWRPYADQKVAAVAPPAEDLITQRLNVDFLDFSNYTENTAAMSEGRYVRTINFNEKHKYADFSGSVDYDATLSCYEPSSGRPGEYHWESIVNLDNLIINWKAEGVWLLTDNSRPLYPEKIYYNLFSYNHEKEDKKPSAEGFYAWPAFDGNEYMGVYGNYKYEGSHIYEKGEKLSEMQLEMYLSCFNSFEIVLHPDSVEAFRVGALMAPEPLDVIYAESDQIIDEWNDFPKNYDKYDFLGY